MPGWETEAQGTQPVATKPGPSPPLRSPCLGLSLPFCARLWAQPCACTEALARRRQGSRMLIQPRGGSKMVRNEGSRLLWGRLCPSSRSSTPPTAQTPPRGVGFSSTPPPPPSSSCVCHYGSNVAAQARGTETFAAAGVASGWAGGAALLLPGPSRPLSLLGWGRGAALAHRFLWRCCWQQ